MSKNLKLNQLSLSLIMRILSKNQDQLVIIHKPFLIWFFCFLWFLIGIGNILYPIYSGQAYVFILIGVAVLISLCIFTLFSSLTRVIIWHFDAQFKKLKASYLFFWSIKTFEYLFDDIKEVQLDTRFDQPLYGIKLLLTNNRYLHLCLDYSLFENTALDGVKSISDFLNINSI